MRDRTMMAAAGFGAMLAAGVAGAQAFVQHGPVARVTIGDQVADINFSPNELPSASLIIRREKQGVMVRLLKTDHELLWVLSDRRMAPLWPQILAWAGDDLSRLRAARLVKAEAAFRRPPRPLSWPGMTPKQAAEQQAGAIERSYEAYRDYGHALFDAGRVADARKVLDLGVALPPLPSDKGFSASMLAISRANIEARLGDTARAIALLEAAERRLSLDAWPTAVNIVANRAQLLAEQGRRAEALAAIEAPAVRAALGKATDRGDRIVGGIRACALTGAKGEAEAARALKALRKQAIDDPDPYRRVLTCRGDVAALRQSYLDRLADPRLFNDDIVDLQPGRSTSGPGRRLLDDMRRDPAVAAAFAARGRPLPGALVPALNGWRPVVP